MLEIHDLSLGFGENKDVTPILDHVSLSIQENEIVAVVGESGRGKSVTAMSIMRLLRTPLAQYLGREILFHGEDLLISAATEVQ